MFDAKLSRKDALRAMALAAALPLGSLPAAAQAKGKELTVSDLEAIERLVGIELTEAERKELLEDVKGSQAEYEALRKREVEQKFAPAVAFAPLGASSDPRAKVEVKVRAARRLDVAKMSDEDLAFLSVRELGGLIKARKLTSVRLTEIYLARLRKHGDALTCVVTLTPEVALKQAKEADAEIAAGRYRGPLHGIPFGIKDLFLTKGIPTTFGAAPYNDQVPTFDASVVERLREAGAVMLAKLSMGSLALGDVWHRGTTKNPWNVKEGSSGSSAGSAAATAAGLVAFAIGTETQGSILSPSVRCRVSGLRPTFGRVSRHGAMELSFSMDKVGPICRTAEDCALVFAAICGEDDRDPTAVSQPFLYAPRRDLKGLKIGYLPKADWMDADPVVKILREAGATVRAHKFSPAPVGVGVVLDVEAAAAFDDLTRSGRIRELKDSPWPRYFRAARAIPAIEYLRAQRVRRAMMEDFDREWDDLDAALDTGIGMSTLVTTNQAGTPQAVIPFGTSANGQPLSYTVLGRAYEESLLLGILDLVQQKTGFHRLRPAL